MASKNNPNFILRPSCWFMRWHSVQATSNHFVTTVDLKQLEYKRHGIHAIGDTRMLTTTVAALSKCLFRKTTARKPKTGLRDLCRKRGAHTRQGSKELFTEVTESCQKSRSRSQLERSEVPAQRVRDIRSAERTSVKKFRRKIRNQ